MKIKTSIDPVHIDAFKNFLSKKGDILSILRTIKINSITGKSSLFLIEEINPQPLISIGDKMESRYCAYVSDIELTVNSDLLITSMELEIEYLSTENGLIAEKLIENKSGIKISISDGQFRGFYVEDQNSNSPVSPVSPPGAGSVPPGGVVLSPPNSEG